MLLFTVLTKIQKSAFCTVDKMSYMVDFFINDRRCKLTVCRNDDLVA